MTGRRVWIILGAVVGDGAPSPCGSMATATQTTDVRENAYAAGSAYPADPLATIAVHAVRFRRSRAGGLEVTSGGRSAWSG